MKPKDKCDTRRETRVFKADEIEMRIEGDGDETRLVGYAARFNKWSGELWPGFREKIAPGAFTDAIKESDVRALKNHDPNLLLGRSTAGTLRLAENKKGLKFECDIPNTTTGHDTLEEIRRGDLSGCSFAFTVESDTWDYKDDDTVERTINKIGELFDVGPVTYPAYPDTTVAARSLDAFKESIKRDEQPPVDETPEPEGQEEVTPTIDFARQQKINADYRYAVRVLNRCRLADD